jgi:hypothetical protein
VKNPIDDVLPGAVGMVASKRCKLPEGLGDSPEAGKYAADLTGIALPATEEYVLLLFVIT